MRTGEQVRILEAAPALQPNDGAQLARAAMKMTSLRILHLCPFFHPVLGGLERVILRLSAEMVRRGHQVTVFTSDLSRNGRLPLGETEVEGVRVVRFRTWFKLGPFAALWPGFCRESMLRSVDVIHAHSHRHPHSNLVALPLLKGQAKLILQPHWPGHPRGRMGAAFTRMYDATLGRRLLSACDLVLALTPHEARWLRSRGARSVAVLPNGIRRELLGSGNGDGFRHRHGMEGFWALSVGRTDWIKGFHVAVEALRELDGVQYAIAGPPGDFHGPLLSLIRRQGLTDRVRLLGELVEDETVEALDACDVFLQPSLFEAFGLSTLEAMARGKPCLGSNAGGLQWLLEGCGLMFRPGDAEGIAQGVRRLRDEPHLRAQLGAAGRQKASRLTWDHLSDSYENLLGRLVEA